MSSKLGNLVLKIGADSVAFEKEIGKVKTIIRQQMPKIGEIFKSHFSQIFSFLSQGTNGLVSEYLAKTKLSASLLEKGFSKLEVEKLTSLSDSFEKLGYSADLANESFVKFISSGQAAALQQVGLFLDKNTQATLKQATAQQRLNFVLSQGSKSLAQQYAQMPSNIRMLTEMNKTTEDLKKSLGASFSQTLSGIISAFGGLEAAMKTAIVAFAAYKTAMILGNVAIGISKAIAANVFVAPIAIAMGASALAAIGTIIGGAVTAFSAVPSVSNSQEPKQASSSSVVELNIKQDKYSPALINAKKYIGT